MGASAPMPRIRGRAAEMAALGEALDRAASGRPAVVLIEGEAGIGKSRLLDDALADAGARGMQMAVGRAGELEQTRPFGVVADAFGCARSSTDPRRAAIGALLTAHHGGDRGPITVTSDPGLRFRAVDAFTDLVEELAVSGPLVIGMDDLQWADPSSLLTLGAVGRRLAYLPVALIGCSRPSPRVAELDRLAGVLEAAGARQLRLRPLAEEAVAGLVAETIAAEPGPRLLAEVAGAGGNPLFVTELVAALIQERAIQIAGGHAEVVNLTLPPTLRLTILRRLSSLPEATLQALRAASILGSGFSLSDLATATAQPALELSFALAEAIRARVLEDDGALLRFRHDLIRESIYADLPGSVRRGLHREIGQRLAQTGAPALQVAEHLARGAGRGDAAAIAWLTRAAREAAARSPDVAVDLLARAAGLMDPADPGRDRLLAERASSLMWAGRIADAEAACRGLLDRDHDLSVEASVRNCLGHALLTQGQGRAAIRELDKAAESTVLTDAERAHGLGWSSFARLWLGDLDGAAIIAEQARCAADVAGDHLTTSIAMDSLAMVSEFRGHLRDALQISEDARRLADQSPGRQGHRHPLYMAPGHILIELGRLDEARATLETGRRISEELGVRWHLPSYQAVRGVERFIAGQWDDAIAELETSLDLADETSSKYSLVYAHGVLSLILYHRGDLRAAQEAAAGAAVCQLSGSGLRYRTNWAVWSRALVLEAGGELAQALAIMTDAWDVGARLGFTHEYPLVGADLVRLALAAGDLGRARDASAAVNEVASRNEVSWMKGAALRCEGLIADDAEILSAAAGAYASGSRPLELALACEDAGAAFARQGEVGRASEPLDRAIEIYEQLDAARDLARAEARRRSAGIRRGRRGTGARNRPKIGWHSLTPTERTIAGLVADGMSNPQIGERLYVSRRTVQTHLAHVFAKLDISSRAQLAAEVTRHRSDQPADAAGYVRR
jgi:DNA-binding CsgD family transcriptional regulator/predicted negative regulator of RcsB-dependent stress response